MLAGASGPRVLIFGTTGQLGRELARADWTPGTVLVPIGREQADFLVPLRLARVVRDQSPDAIVIAAAYTAVDRAESEPELARRINAEAPEAIAAAAAERNVPVVYVSTDYVFDGSKDGWYVEDDPTSPLGAYGRSKEEGERRLRAANDRHLILRTAWFYSPFGVNFVKTMLRLAQTRDEVGIVDDQVGCPTAAGDLAAAIASVVPRLLGSQPAFGTYHAVGAEQTTWHRFAEAIFQNLAARGARRPRNRPIATKDFPTPAKRPANSRLDSHKLEAAFGLRLPSWQTALPRVLDELIGQMETTRETTA